MKKLLKLRKKPYYNWINTVGKRIAIIIISVFIAGTTTILSVEAIREKVVGFFIEIFEKYSIIQHDGEEDAQIEHIEINGYKAIIFTDNHNYNHIIWEDQDYVFTISANIEQNALIEMAESVQKVE